MFPLRKNTGNKKTCVVEHSFHKILHNVILWLSDECFKLSCVDNNGLRKVTRIKYDFVVATCLGHIYIISLKAHRSQPAEKKKYSYKRKINYLPYYQLLRQFWGFFLTRFGQCFTRSCRSFQKVHVKREPVPYLIPESKKQLETR